VAPKVSELHSEASPKKLHGDDEDSGAVAADSVHLEVMETHQKMMNMVGCSFPKALVYGGRPCSQAHLAC
jgi:hypothetical protein